MDQVFFSAKFGIILLDMENAGHFVVVCKTPLSMFAKFNMPIASVVLH